MKPMKTFNKKDKSTKQAKFEEDELKIILDEVCEHKDVILAPRSRENCDHKDATWAAITTKVNSVPGVI